MESKKKKKKTEKTEKKKKKLVIKYDEILCVVPNVSRAFMIVEYTY